MAAKNLRQFEFKLGKLGLFLFIFGLAILVFVGFILGVQVGRNIDTYPEMIARGIPLGILSSLGVTAPVIKREVPVGAAGADQPDGSAGEGKSGTAVQGRDAAAIIAAPPSVPAAPTEKMEPPVAPAATPPADSPAPAAAPSVMPQKATASEPEANAPQKPPAAPGEAKKEKAPPDKNGGFTIQVVSFREKEKADGLSRKIKALGYSPKVSVTDVTGKGQWYRVTVNGFATKQAAEKAADDLTGKIKGVSCVIRGKQTKTKDQ